MMGRLEGVAADGWIEAPDLGGDVCRGSTVQDGTILGLGIDNKLYTRTNLEAKWVMAANDGKTRGCGC